MAWANSRGKGASQVMRNHIRAQGTKGNRKPSASSRTSQSGASNRVGGSAGANFDNSSVGR